MRCVVYVCVLISTPLVFIAGSHGVRLLQPTSATSGEAARGEVEELGPMSQVGRPVGRRPARWANRSQLRPAGCLGPPCLVHGGLGLSWLV